MNENERVITDAFARLRRGERELVPAALGRMLADAVDYALQFHDSEHRSHIELGDNYAWMIVHDGKEVGRWVKAASAEYGGANGMLDGMLASLPSTGWVGVVMAGMKPDHYYELDYEMDVMRDVISLTPDLFDRYFKRREL